MSALIDIALSTQKSGKFVSQEQIDRARSEGADDKAIHDTVLIAAAFCMFNRYVDGLAAWTPENTQIYEEIGKRLAGNGYDSPSR
jgi:alkylhydroperoxidase family enzyme